jgi:hypothetical protein
MQEPMLSKRSKRQCASKAVARVFGAPPVLPGEDPKEYEKMLSRVATDIGPRDFIEEIWVHDLADATWDLFRWRRIKAAHLAAKVLEAVNDKALQVAVTKLMALEGPEKDEIDAFHKCKLSRAERLAAYPRVHEKLEKLLAESRATLNVDHIEAEVIHLNLKFIEQIEGLIATAQDRIDQIMRELNRHRFMQNQGRLTSPAMLEDKPKKIAAPLVTIVPHGQ